MAGGAASPAVTGGLSRYTPVDRCGYRCLSLSPHTRREDVCDSCANTVKYAVVTID